MRKSWPPSPTIWKVLSIRQFAAALAGRGSSKTKGLRFADLRESVRHRKRVIRREFQTRGRVALPCSLLDWREQELPGCVSEVPQLAWEVGRVAMHSANRGVDGSRCRLQATQYMKAQRAQRLVEDE